MMNIYAEIDLYFVKFIGLYNMNRIIN